MEKFQSDGMQVIGEKLLIGQLAPWVTWERYLAFRAHFVSRVKRRNGRGPNGRAVDGAENDPNTGRILHNLWLFSR